MKNPFKKSDDNGIPHWVDESIIKDYEKSIEVEKEILKEEELQIETAKKMKAIRHNPTQEQSDIDDLRIHMYELGHLGTQRDMTVTGMHIQSLKAIVALEKIITSIQQKLPLKETKEFVSKLDEVKNENTQTKQEMNKIKENVEKQLEEAKKETEKTNKSLREVEHLKRQHDEEIKEADGKKDDN